MEIDRKVPVEDLRIWKGNSGDYLLSQYKLAISALIVIRKRRCIMYAFLKSSGEDGVFNH